MEWREQRRRALARGRAARRPGRLLDPPRRRQRGALRQPQPRRPHRRRARRGGREPAPARGGARPRARAGRDRPPGPRRRARDRTRRPQSPSPFAEPGSRDPRGRRPRRRRARAWRRSSSSPTACPVALAGPGGVAMLHCGWRGLAAGIVARGAEAVGATDAAIGPGIGPCCYEVGDEVLDAFADLGAGDRRRAACSTSPRSPAACSRGPASSGSRSPASAPAASRSSSSPTGATRGRTGRQAGLVWLERGAAEVAEPDPRDRPGQDRRQPRAGARAGRGRGSRSSPRPSTCRSRRWGRWPRPG